MSKRLCSDETNCKDCLDQSIKRDDFQSCRWDISKNICNNWYDNPDNAGSYSCSTNTGTGSTSFGSGTSDGTQNTTIIVIVMVSFGVLICIIGCFWQKRYARTDLNTGITTFSIHAPKKRLFNNANISTKHQIRKQQKQQQHQYINIMPIQQQQQQISGINCINCGYMSINGSKFCQGCGIKLGIECVKCGESLNENMKFCNNCGNCINIQPSAPVEDSIDDNVYDNINNNYDNEGLPEYEQVAN